MAAPFDPWKPDGWECCIWLLAERDGEGMASRRYCGKHTCPGCMEHYARCFRGRTVRVVVVADGKAWRALCRRIDRSGGLVLGVPAPDRDVIAFNDVLGDVVADPMAELAEAMEARPDDGRRMRPCREWALDPREAKVRDDEVVPADDDQPSEEGDPVEVALCLPDRRPTLTLVPDPPPRWRTLGWSGATPNRLLEAMGDLDLEPLTFPPFAKGRAIKAIGFRMPALADPRRLALEDRIGLRRRDQAVGVA